MTKPFNILEVKTASRPCAGRNSPAGRCLIYRVRDLEVNVINRSVILSGEDVRLTAKEFDLLQLFLAIAAVFTREEILDAVWRNDYTGDARTVDVHIRRLREKIERSPNQPEFIFTKWGVGYYFTDRDD